jgi:glycosyltransferase involved in cell wall biosynthesis
MGKNCSFHNPDLKMNIPPKISVIIVVYNAVKTLEKAMNSVLQQTYKNIELVIIDGGSVDGTLEILKKYEESKLKWISEPDKGIYDAMNKGIRIASGEWLYFLGADDELFDNKTLENIFKESNVDDVALLYGNVKRGASKRPYDGVFAYQKLLKKNISHQAIFYNKNIFKKIGNYNVRYKTHADWDLNLRCFEYKNISARYIDRIIATFGTGGLSVNYDIPFLRESLMPQKMEFLKTNNRTLYNLKNYDEWWRFIRNSGFRHENDFYDSGYKSHVPDVILSMVKWQNKLPDSLLKNGVFSKISMFINYLFCYRKIRN